MVLLENLRSSRHPWKMPESIEKICLVRSKMSHGSQTFQGIIEIFSKSIECNYLKLQGVKKNSIREPKQKVSNISAWYRGCTSSRTSWNSKIYSGNPKRESTNWPMRCSKGHIRLTLSKTITIRFSTTRAISTMRVRKCSFEKGISDISINF